MPPDRRDRGLCTLARLERGERDGRCSTAPAAATRRCASWLAERHGVEPGPRLHHERLAPGLRLPLAAPRARRHARSRRGADLRPAAEDPRSGSAPRSSPSRWTTTASTSPRSSRLEGDLRSSTRSRPSRTRAGARCRSSARDAAGRARARARPARDRGRPVRPRPLRGRAAAVAASSSPAGGARRLLVVVLEDDRARGSGSATSSCPPISRRRSRRLAVSTYISPAVFYAGDRLGVPPHAAASSRTSSASAACCARGATRCSRRSSASCPGDATWSRPEGGYFIWLDLPAARRGRAARARPRQNGVTFVQGHRLLRRRRRRRAVAAARLQLRLAGRDRRGRRPPRGASCAARSRVTLAADAARAAAAAAARACRA